MFGGHFRGTKADNLLIYLSRSGGHVVNMAVVSDINLTLGAIFLKAGTELYIWVIARISSSPLRAARKPVVRLFFASLYLPLLT